MQDNSNTLSGSSVDVCRRRGLEHQDTPNNLRPQFQSHAPLSQRQSCVVEVVSSKFEEHLVYMERKNLQIPCAKLSKKKSSR